MRRSAHGGSNWYWLWLLLVSQGCLASLSAGSQATGGPLVDRLESVWSAQRRDVRTVELRFRRFRRGGDFLRRTRSEFHELLQRFDLAENPDALRPMVVELLGRTLPVDPPWAVREFLQSQQRVRERGPGWDLIVDGSSELVCDEGQPIHQVVHTRKGSATLGGCAVVRLSLGAP